MSELQKSVETRVIQVYFNGEAINIQTNANKWSDVVPLIENHENGFSTNGKKAVLGSTKGVLQLPDALIPDGNQAIFLVQDKMKSGATIKAVKPFTDMSFVDLRRLAKEKGITGLGSNPNRTQLIDALNGATGIKEIKGNSKVAKEAKVKIVQESKAKVKELTPDLEQRVTEMETVLGSFVEGLSVVLSKITGRSFSIIEKSSNTPVESIKQIETQEKSFGAGTNKLKSDAELAEEFKNLKLK